MFFLEPSDLPSFFSQRTNGIKLFLPLVTSRARRHLRRWPFLEGPAHSKSRKLIEYVRHCTQHGPEGFAGRGSVEQVSRLTARATSGEKSNTRICLRTGQRQSRSPESSLEPPERRLPRIGRN